MSRDRSPIVLDPAKVRAFLNGRSPKEVEVLSRKRVSGAAVRRCLNGQPVSLSLGEHLSEALGCDLQELKREKRK